MDIQLFSNSVSNKVFFLLTFSNNDKTAKLILVVSYATDMKRPYMSISAIHTHTIEKFSY